MIDSRDQATARKGRIKDARGRKVTQFNPVGMYLVRQYHAIEAEPLKAIANDADLRITRAERTFMIVGIAALSAIASLFLHSVFFRGLGNAPYAKSSALIYFCFMPWLIWFIIRRSRYHKTAPVLLKHYRCPHCGYDLRDLPVDPDDGATICPECGCAWKLNTPGPTEQAQVD